MPDQAFDHIAGQYDATFTESRIGHLQREQVYSCLSQILAKNQIHEVLEINCGTGTDALWLASQGCRVLATDISGAMLGACQKKVKEKGFTELVGCQQLAIEQLDQLPNDAAYDLIFSNFGGLNCVSPGQLGEIARQMHRLLRPGGRLVAVVMGRKCWWEQFYFFIKGNWKVARRRRRKEAVPARLSAEVSVDTWYYTPAELLHYLQAHFNERQAQPIGFFVPPSYLESLFADRAKHLARLARWDSHLPAGRWWGNRADHFLIELVRSNDPDRDEPTAHL